MKTRFKNISDTFEKKPQKKRLMILVLGMILILIMWFFIIYGPLNESLKQMNSGIDFTNQQRNQINGLIETTINEVNAKAEELNARTKQFKSLNKPLVTYTKIKTLEQFDSLMKDILNAQGNLIVSDIKKNSADGVFTIEIKLQCTYFQAREYLQRLEALPWCITWDVLEYKVATYPEANMTIMLRAVSE